jgi:hypothetical protein
MKTVQRKRRTRRAANPNMECLDDRIVPSTVHAAVGAGAEAVAAVSVAQRHENHLVRLEVRHEKAVARIDLRRARREARFLAHHPHSRMPTTGSNASGIIPVNGSGTLPANVSVQLQSLYSQYETYASSGGGGTFSPTGVNLLVINGTNVGIQVKDSNTGDFNTLTTELLSDGMQILVSDPTYGIVEGMIPIAQLPTVAQVPQSVSITPMLNPILQSAA